MHTVKSETYNGDTVAMKKDGSHYMVTVNGRRASSPMKSKKQAEREYNRCCNRYRGDDMMMGGSRYGEDTVRDALGL